jgi:hypothetical protein
VRVTGAARGVGRPTNDVSCSARTTRPMSTTRAGLANRGRACEIRPSAALEAIALSRMLCRKLRIRQYAGARTPQRRVGYKRAPQARRSNTFAQRRTAVSVERMAQNVWPNRSACHIIGALAIFAGHRVVSHGQAIQHICAAEDAVSVERMAQQVSLPHNWRARNFRRSSCCFAWSA